MSSIDYVCLWSAINDGCEYVNNDTASSLEAILKWRCGYVVFFGI
jgi:hypothetical protein